MMKSDQECLKFANWGDYLDKEKGRQWQKWIHQLPHHFSR